MGENKVLNNDNLCCECNHSESFRCGLKVISQQQATKGLSSLTQRKQPVTKVLVIELKIPGSNSFPVDIAAYRGHVIFVSV